MESENHCQNHPEHKPSSLKEQWGFPETFSLFSAILNSQENLEVMLVEDHMVFNNEECFTGLRVWRCSEETTQAHDAGSNTGDLAKVESLPVAGWCLMGFLNSFGS